MNKKIVFLFAVIMIMCTSCNRQSFFPEVDVSDSITESGNITNEIPIALNESENFNQEFNGELDLERLKIFGTWSLDKIILSSKEYTGEKNWGDGHIFKEKEYIGYEVEYTTDYIRLGNQKFFSPMYEITELSFYEFNNNGDFENPDLSEFVKKEGMYVNKMEEYENMDNIPLIYFLITFKENNFIPVGTQCVFLDENTMLVGVWGDVILAHRLE